MNWFSLNQLFLAVSIVVQALTVQTGCAQVFFMSNFRSGLHWQLSPFPAVQRSSAVCACPCSLACIRCILFWRDGIGYSDVISMLLKRWWYFRSKGCCDSSSIASWICLVEACFTSSTWVIFWSLSLSANFPIEAQYIYF